MKERTFGAREPVCAQRCTPNSLAVLGTAISAATEARGGPVRPEAPSWACCCSWCVSTTDSLAVGQARSGAAAPQAAPRRCR